MSVLRQKRTNRSPILISLSCLMLAVSVGNFSASAASASETPPAPYSTESSIASLSLVGMTGVGMMPTFQAISSLSGTERLRVRMAFADGSGDRAIKMQIVSRKTLPGSAMSLISLKLTGIDLWNLSPADLSNIRFLEIGHQALSVNTFKPVRSIHWMNVSPMSGSSLNPGVLSGYRIQSDGSILVQFKKSNNKAITEPTLL